MMLELAFNGCGNMGEFTQGKGRHVDVGLYDEATTWVGAVTER